MGNKRAFAFAFAHRVFGCPQFYVFQTTPPPPPQIAQMPRRFVAFHKNDDMDIAISAPTIPVSTKHPIGGAEDEDGDKVLAPLPVIESRVYDELVELCDCSLFTECPLGKGVTRRYRKLVLAPMETVTDQCGMNTGCGKGRGEMEPRIRSRRWTRGTEYPWELGADYSTIPPAASSSGSSITSDSPSGSRDNTGVLFRLPLNITRAMGHSSADCRVRGRSASVPSSPECPRRIRQAPRVDFAGLGLFVAPPSDTDPDEAFVVVQRRRYPLLSDKLSPVGELVSSSYSVASALSPRPTVNNHAPVSGGDLLVSPRRGPSGIHQSASADNLLIRVQDAEQARRKAEQREESGGGGHVVLHHHHHHYAQQSPQQGKSFEEEGEPAATASAGGARARQGEQLSPNSLRARGGGETVSGERDEMAPPAVADPRIRQIWSEAIELGEIRNVEDQTEFRSLRAQLGIDKISAETLGQYHVKGHMDHFDHPAICYPRYRGPATRGRLPSGLKLIRRLGPKLVKENYPAEEDKARFSGMFGLHMITQFDNRVVLTTNERDALAVFDASNGIPALSLPNGERFDPTVLPYLEDFDLVYLWFPHIHERFAKDYASYLNATRCYIITASLRPVELIRDGRGKEVLHSIQDAVRVRYKGFRSVGDLRDAVRGEIVQSKGRLGGWAQWRRYALLNNYLRGFRPGEITVISGGHQGKTTFLCEYAMDLYIQGIRTLFCNFEMPEEKILKWMLIQFAGPSHVRSQARARSHAFFASGTRAKAPLQRQQEHSSVEMWLDKFERTQSDLLVMKMDEFRDKTLKEIADAIRDQVVTSGIQHLVIDNLQSLVDLATLHIESMSAAERAHQQDRFVGMLRRVVNTQDIHITLVVHPVREPNEHGYFELQHIGNGPSAKITQEADNVLVIQRRRDFDDRRRFRKFLYILKNRFGGRCVEVDQIEMLFQPTTLMHTLVEVTK